MDARARLVFVSVFFLFAQRAIVFELVFFRLIVVHISSLPMRQLLIFFLFDVELYLHLVLN